MSAKLDHYFNYYSNPIEQEPKLSPEECRVIPWFRVDGDKKFRYSYNLNKNSVAYDMGGYKGEWAEKINKLYGCKVEVFEPVLKFVEILEKKFKDNPKVNIYPFGLEGRTYTERISLDLASSSTFKKGAKTEKIELVKASDFIPKSLKIDLIKINIEGGEYELLEHLIKTGLIKNITDLQLQFHEFVPNGRKKRLKIQELLGKTHVMTYNYPFIWENWRRK
ncbi:MAG: FkbM family methyltransferase [Patescibacteria group bacterium]